MISIVVALTRIESALEALLQVRGGEGLQNRKLGEAKDHLESSLNSLMVVYEANYGEKWNR